MVKEKNSYRIVFMGTPELAATVLRSVAGWEHGEIVAVYTQPDRPAGRGHKYTPSPVKCVAQEFGFPLEQPLHFKEEETCLRLEAYKPDFLLVAAYGLLLPQRVIDTPQFPPLNVHTSLLPRYRGAAPIQRVIMENWDENAQSGVSIMEIVKALDAGPVYAQETLSIAGHTAGSLHDALATMGGALLLRVLDDFRQGKAKATPQNDAEASYAAKLEKSDGFIDWQRPCAAVDAHIRGVTPWPGARCSFLFDGQENPTTLLIQPGQCAEQALPRLGTGSLWWDGKQLFVACLDGWYTLGMLRPQGKKDMDAKAFMNGFCRDAAHGCCGHAVQL